MRFLFLLPGLVAAGIGPLALYSRLANQTFSVGSYTLSPYTSISAAAEVNTSIGFFRDFVAVNGEYEFQQYADGNGTGGCSSRGMQLYIQCADTIGLSTVFEPVPCLYVGTFRTPEACGIDMRVGYEAAAPSGTPTPRPSASGTATPTQTASGSPSLVPPPVAPSSQDKASLALAALAFAGVVGGGLWMAVKKIRSGGGIGEAIAACMENRKKLRAMTDKLPISAEMRGQLNSALDNPNQFIPSDMQKKLQELHDKVPEGMRNKLKEYVDKKMEEAATGRGNEEMEEEVEELDEEESAGVGPIGRRGSVPTTAVAAEEDLEEDEELEEEQVQEGEEEGQGEQDEQGDLEVEMEEEEEELQVISEVPTIKVPDSLAKTLSPEDLETVQKMLAERKRM